MKKSLVTAICAAALAAGCTESPKYMAPPLALEIDPGMVDEDAPPPSVVFLLPYHVETEDELDERVALAEDLGIAEVPIARREEMDVSIEWTIRNLDADNEATVELAINGANEYFRYVPDVFVIDPEEDPTPPSLIAPPPVRVPPGATMTGVVREDQVREAALDLEMITRGVDDMGAPNNPFAALLTVHEELTEFQTATETIPRDAIAGLVELEFSMTTNRRVVLEFAVRVRDEEDRLHEDLLQAPAGELIVFMPADYTPPPPPAM